MRFEDLEVWKRAVSLSVRTYKAVGDLKDYGFKDQITRSSLSIPSNIAEGFEHESNKECLRFLGYAKASCGEFRTQVIIGFEVGYLSKIFYEWAIHESKELSAMLTALIKTRKSFS